MANERPLRELNPSWVYAADKPQNFWGMFEPPPSDSELGEWIGLSFDCPICKPGAHRVMITKPNVPEGWNFLPNVKRGWDITRVNWDDVTAHPSIACETGDCKFHGWLKKGRVTW